MKLNLQQYQSQVNKACRKLFTNLSSVYESSFPKFHYYLTDKFSHHFALFPFAIHTNDCQKQKSKNTTSIVNCMWLAKDLRDSTEGKRKNLENEILRSFTGSQPMCCLSFEKRFLFASLHSFYELWSCCRSEIDESKIENWIPMIGKPW